MGVLLIVLIGSMAVTIVLLCVAIVSIIVSKKKSDYDRYIDDQEQEAYMTNHVNSNKRRNEE